MPARPTRLGAFHVALAWALALLAWAAVGAFLQAGFRQPWLGPGSLVLLGLLAAGAWALVEEPRLEAGRGPQALSCLAGLILLGSGQALLYPELGGGHEALAPLGFGLLLLGAGLLWAKGRGQQLGLGAAAAMVLLGIYTWAQRSAPWDLFYGLWRGQSAMALFWTLLALGIGSLAWQARGLRLDLSGPPLSRPVEAGGLALVLAAGAFLRFWRPAALPQGYWFDEVNLARAIQDHVLSAGRAPLYLTEQVENPGAWLWVGGALFKAFGVDLDVLRLASGAFGLLAVLPFWALARLWLGPRWALAAALLFACMRWTLIPQRIAFMSGFALFWMLTAFWALWWAWLKGGIWRWGAAGLALGANLHTYTPARLVPLIVAAFLLLQLLPGLRSQGPRLGWRGLAALAVGFLLTAGPMLWYIREHWAAYTLRSEQVSIFTDVKQSGRSLPFELWGTLTKHLLMFNFRGDFNARHNLHFLPQVDLVSAAALTVAAPVLLGQALRDARARFILLWGGAMLAAGILTLPVEAPQGHRTVLAAPALALGLVLGLAPLGSPVKAAFGGAWPQSLKALGLVLLLGSVGLNAWELLKVWPVHPATFHSFSPRASAVMRRVQASPPQTMVYVSHLPGEYQYHGYEWGAFARFALGLQNRPWAVLRPEQAVPAQGPHGPTRSALLIWGESDQAVSAAVGALWPGLAVHREPQPHPAPGEPAALYLAVEVPYELIPPRPAFGPAPLLWRESSTR